MDVQHELIRSQAQLLPIADYYSKMEDLHRAILVIFLSY